MIEIENGKYFGLIRQDYLYGFGRYCETKEERSKMIVAAVEYFLKELSEEERQQTIQDEISCKRPGLRTDLKYSHRKYLEVVHISNDLMLQLEHSEPSFYNLEIKLNTVIKVFLEKFYPNFLDAPEPHMLIAQIFIPAETAFAICQLPINEQRTVIEKLVSDKLTVELADPKLFAEILEK